jgi:Tfp pilus assembly protein PilO
MSTTVAAVVLALAGVAAVVAVSWVFYRIGKAEDREREREEAEAARRAPPRDEPQAPGAARERRRPLPPRRP